MLPIATMSRSLKLWLLPMTLALAAPALAQQGALTVSRNLDQLTDRAAIIVRGNVVNVRVEKHPEWTNLDTVVVTLRVRESLKGAASGTHTFRQYIWDLRDRQDAAGYRKGQDLLLFLVAPSRYGLSSPAGLDQGRFRIERDAGGREVAVNAVDNYRLFDGVAAEAAKEGAALSPASLRLAGRQSGPVPLADLARLVRELAVGAN